MAMVPHERSLVKRFQDRPFVLLGVNADGSRDVFKAVEERQEITWRSWFDGRSGPIAAKYQIDGFPTLFLIDDEGIITRVFEGKPRDADLDPALQALVQKVEERAAAKTALAKPALRQSDFE